MIQEAITDQLTGMVPDIAAVAAVFLVSIIIMRSFKQMAYSIEFERQFNEYSAKQTKSLSFEHLQSGVKEQWKKEYIANRSGGVKRQIQQKKQRAAFNYSRPGGSNTAPKPNKTNFIQKLKTNNVVRELKGLKQIKDKYGVKSAQISRFRQQQINSDAHFKNFESDFKKNNPQLNTRLSLKTGKFQSY